MNRSQLISGLLSNQRRKIKLGRGGHPKWGCHQTNKEERNPITMQRQSRIIFSDPLAAAVNILGNS